MAKLHIHKGDQVVVISGRDKGKTGKVLRVFPSSKRAIVEKLNLVKDHQRPTQKGTGGVVDKEAPLDLSNLKVVCGSCNQPARTGRRLLEDGSRVRFCKKCNELLS